MSQDEQRQRSPNGLWYPRRGHSSRSTSPLKSPPPTLSSRGTTWWNTRNCLLVAAVVVALVAALLNKDSLSSCADTFKAGAKAFLDWSESAAKQAGSLSVFGVHVPLGPVVIMLSYVVACVFMLPLFGFHSVSGYLYGTIPGALLVTVSQTIGATCCFYVARLVANNYLTTYLRNKWGKKYTAIDEAITQDCFKIVLMMRLSPVIPFGLTNYVAGCSRVPVSKFSSATWLGLCPGTTFYVFMGSLVRMIEEDRMSQEEKDAQAGWRMYLIGFGLCATAYLLYSASQKATKVLADAGFKDE